jgi:hypothetical protein
LIRKRPSPPAEGAFPNFVKLSTNIWNDWQLIGYTDWPPEVNHGMNWIYRSPKSVLRVPK